MQPGAQLAWWSLTSTVLTLRSLTWTPHPRPHHQYPYPLRQAPLATTNRNCLSTKTQSCSLLINTEHTFMYDAPILCTALLTIKKFYHTLCTIFFLWIISMFCQFVVHV